MDQKAKFPSNPFSKLPLKISHGVTHVNGIHFLAYFETETFLLTVDINLEDLVGGARPIWGCLQ